MPFVIDLKGQTIVVTGGNRGIGEFTFLHHLYWTPLRSLQDQSVHAAVDRLLDWEVALRIPEASGLQQCRASLYR